MVAVAGVTSVTCAFSNRLPSTVMMVCRSARDIAAKNIAPRINKVTFKVTFAPRLRFLARLSLCDLDRVLSLSFSMIRINCPSALKMLWGMENLRWRINVTRSVECGFDFRSRNVQDLPETADVFAVD